MEWLKHQISKLGQVFRLALIVGIISGLIVSAILLTDQKETTVSESAIKAMCVHLNEKWRAEGKDWYIKDIECKVRKPLRGSTPSSRE